MPLLSVIILNQHAFSYCLLPISCMGSGICSSCENSGGNYTHYLMMGVNERSKGAYRSDDFQFSLKFPDVETREQANIKLCVDRLNAMRTGHRLGKFIKGKALINFNDGICHDF